MKSLSNKDAIVTSLLTYLPSISTSLVDLVNSVKGLIENPKPRESSNIKDIMDHLIRVVNPSLELIQATTNIKDSEIDEELIKLYRNSMINVVHGMNSMNNWLSDQSIPDEKLKDAIDQLFKGGQQIIDLVDKLTRI